VSLERKLQWLAAVVFGSAALFLFPSSARAQTQPAAPSLDGLWLTDGYGMLIEFESDQLQIFEVTRVSCIPTAKATRKQEASGQELLFTGGDGDTYRVSPGPSPDARWLHEDGSVSSIVLRHTAARPAACGLQSARGGRPD